MAAILHEVFFRVKKLGIYCFGRDGRIKIENNVIEKNNGGPGIKVGIANKCKIIGNDIRENYTGIEVASSDPLIF